MRWLMLLVFLASLPPYAGATKRVSVVQLEEALTTARSVHKLDVDIARQIGDSLSERLTEATFNRLSASLYPGSKRRWLCDCLRSVGFSRPAGERVTVLGSSDGAATADDRGGAPYVAKTVPQLPDLAAIRTTNRYDHRPQVIKQGGWPVRAGLHLVSTASREISVFEERTSEPHCGISLGPEQSASISGGKFGSTLSMILTDTVKGKVKWSHWEQAAAGPVAVFHYSVPSSASAFRCHQLASAAGDDSGHVKSQSRLKRGFRHRSETKHGFNTSTFITRPGYHGLLWSEPVTGSILTHHHGG